MTTEPISTLNRFLIGRRGNKVTSLKLRVDLTRQEALNLAAWLVVIAEGIDEPGAPSFAEGLRTIENADLRVLVLLPWLLVLVSLAGVVAWALIIVLLVLR